MRGIGSYIGLDICRRWQEGERLLFSYFDFWWKQWEGKRFSNCLSSLPEERNVVLYCSRSLAEVVGGGVKIGKALGEGSWERKLEKGK